MLQHPSSSPIRMQQVRNSLDRLGDARADPLRRPDPVDALLAHGFHFLEEAILRDQGDEERIGEISRWDRA
jgi:hypothetical protein